MVGNRWTSSARRRVGLITVLIVSVGSVLFPSGSASAKVYGTARWSPSGVYDGVRANLRVTRIGLSTNSNNFINADLWVLPDATNWVEQGANRKDDAPFRWFWAEGCGTTYAEHYPAVSTFVNSTYESKISWNVNSWAIYRDGAFLANSSTCHFYEIYQAHTGTESELSNNVITGTSTVLEKRAASNKVWSSNWGGATLRQDPPTSVSWTTLYGGISFSLN